MARPRKGTTAQEALAEIDRRIEAGEDPLLALDELDEIKKRAREHVRKKRKQIAEDQEFDRQVRLAEREYEPDEQLVDLIIDLPKFAAHVRLDNVVYFHGLVYEVPMRVAATINDVMGQAWAHDNEINGRPRSGDDARKPMNRNLTPKDSGLRLTSIQDLHSLR